MVVHQYVEAAKRWAITNPLRSLFLLISIILWTLIGMLHNRMSPQFVSHWALILPGSGNGHAVNLESIGQASASNPSPYGGSSSLNPNANYKAIALSQPVLTKAAAKLNLTLQELGTPKIKLVDQTSIMSFQIGAGSPEAAQQKGWAMYEALQEQLTLLRDDEQIQVHQSMMMQIDVFGDNLQTAQSQKLAFQVNADVITTDQFAQLISNLEKERAALDELVTEATALELQIQASKKLLGVTDLEIIQAVNLRNDLLFQKLLKRHAELHEQMATVDGSWGKNHPQRLKLDAAHHELNTQISQRGRRLTNNNDISLWRLIEIGNSEFENPLFQSLLDLITNKARVDSEVKSRTLTINKQQVRIAKQTPTVAALEDLARREQVATAVFTTAIAKKDIGQADRFSSYPLVQVLTPPTLPTAAKKLKPTLLIVGGVFCQLFVSLGLMFLWFRRR